MEANYRLIYRVIEGKKTKKVKLGGENCHDTKSAAGRLFQSPSVESVTVADIKGNVYLYLVKYHPEKTEDVPSVQALFG